MNNSTPCVTIGMPVYNGEQFLKQALDSILAQTFKDFELVISDNASTDATQEICHDYAASDRRIRYHRNEKNIGCNNNFNRVFELSTGKYFKWAAHDDVLHPSFLSKCTAVLERDPSIVMCYSKTGDIDAQGILVGTYDTEMNANLPKPHERFRELICVNHSCFSLFGVIRSDTLRMTQLLGLYIGSDWNLLAELSLLGKLYEIPQTLFFRRDHPQASTRLYDDRDRLAWDDPTKVGRISFPYWRRFIEYFVSVTHTQLSWSERLLCYAQMSRWLVGSSYTNQPRWRLLASDLKVAGRRILASSGPALDSLKKPKLQRDLTQR